jgi:hypothetical protein
VYGSFYTGFPFSAGDMNGGTSATFGNNSSAVLGGSVQAANGVIALGGPAPVVGWQVSVTGDYFVEFSAFTFFADPNDAGFNAFGLANGGSGAFLGGPATVYPQSICSATPGQYTSFATTIEANAGDVIGFFNLTSGGSGVGTVQVGNNSRPNTPSAFNISFELIETP